MLCFWYYGALGTNFSGEIQFTRPFGFVSFETLSPPRIKDKSWNSNYSRDNSLKRSKKIGTEPPPVTRLSISSKSKGKKGYFPSLGGHRCDHFAFPPPPPADRRRTGPRRKFSF